MTSKQIMNKETAKNLMKKVIKDYSDISEDFHKTRKIDWKEFNLYIDYIKDNTNIADLGCGNGRFYNFIKKQHKKAHYIGIDNNEKLLEKAKETFGEKLFKLGDLTDIPLETNSIDVACSIAAFHHIPSLEFKKKSLKEIHRIIKKDGILIISVWNLFQEKYKKYIWHSRLKWLLSFGKYDSRDTFIPWRKSGVKRYYHAFTMRELRKLLKTNGFEIISEHFGRNFTFICKKS